LGDVSRSPGKIYLSLPSTTRRIDGSKESSAIASLQFLSDAWPTIAAKLVNLGSDRTERTPGAMHRAFRIFQSYRDSVMGDFGIRLSFRCGFQASIWPGELPAFAYFCKEIRL
jgi:hypothetical protein